MYLGKFTLCLFICCLMFVDNNYAQGKYGADSVKCVENLSVYREYMKQKNYKDAIIGWRYVFSSCPAASEHIYVDGITLMKNDLSVEKDATRKIAYADTIMLIYDKRIQYFNKEGYNKGRKGYDMLFLYKDKEAEAYNLFKSAYELQGDKLEAAPCDGYFRSAVALNKAGKISLEETMDVYNKVNNIISNNLKDKPGEKYYTSAQESVESALAGLGIDCNKLVEIFTPKFNSNPDNLEVIKSVIKLLDKCTETQLYLDAAIALDKLEPSAASKTNIGKMYFAKNNLSEAVKYYNQAIELETDNDTKAQYHYELAKVYQKMGSLTNARAHAQKAIALKANWGQPYILIGDLYASSSKECAENELTQKAVYWYAIDKYQQAKSVDAAVSEEANKRIGTYSQYFPAGEMIFFHTLNEGDSYTIPCWIGETTKVRALK